MFFELGRRQRRGVGPSILGLWNGLLVEEYQGRPAIIVGDVNDMHRTFFFDGIHWERNPVGLYLKTGAMMSRDYQDLRPAERNFHDAIVRVTAEHASVDHDTATIANTWGRGDDQYLFAMKAGSVMAVHVDGRPFHIRFNGQTLERVPQSSSGFRSRLW